MSGVRLSRTGSSRRCGALGALPGNSRKLQIGKDDHSLINNRQQSGRRRGRGGQRQNGSGGGGGGRSPEMGNRIDSRARGNAPQLLEKYKTLARDAQQAGDRVLAEYYLQFADHYFRVLAESRARYEEANPRARQAPRARSASERLLDGSATCASAGLTLPGR